MKTSEVYVGAEGTIVATFDDKTLALEFGDGVEFDFPYEAIDIDGLSRADGANSDGPMCPPCNVDTDLEAWNKLSAQAFTYVWNKKL